MVEIIIDSLIDSLKLVPFLFVAFLIIEFIEHKLSDKNKEIISKKSKYGPIIGSILGTIPQCGFSVMATNLYVTRIISLGTLISIYLSTSDEMLPLLLSEKVDISIISKILIIKVVIGMIIGIIIDFAIRKSKKTQAINHNICDEEHCDCENGIFLSSLKHTLNIAVFILICNIILNITFEYYGNKILENILMKGSIFSPFITSFIGLIPNCGSSVILTKLFISDVITISSLISGLLTGTGVAIIVLFRENKDVLENIKILITIYIIGVVSGIIIGLL